MKKIIIAVFLAFLALPTMVSAHPGRTDSSGCHTCRTNCASWGLSTGEYHCHRAKSLEPQPVEPIKSHKVEGGTGYTTPAPEYKEPKSPVDNSPVKAETKTENKAVLGIKAVEKNASSSAPIVNTKKEITANPSAKSGDTATTVFWSLVIGAGSALFIKSRIDKKNKK